MPSSLRADSHKKILRTQTKFSKLSLQCLLSKATPLSVHSEIETVNPLLRLNLPFKHLHQLMEEYDHRLLILYNRSLNSGIIDTWGPQTLYHPGIYRIFSRISEICLLEATSIPSLPFRDWRIKWSSVRITTL